MKKQVHPALELGLVIALIVALIIFIWNVDFSFGTKSKQQASTPDLNTEATAPSAEKDIWLTGKNLFKSNCAACHNPKADGTGPSLLGTVGRWEAAGEYKGKTGKQWLYSWIKNWNDPANAGYKYAVSMSSSRASQMNLFTQLSDEQIAAILNYTETPDAFKP